MAVWLWWLVGIVLLFFCIEGFALVTRRIPTLSRTTVRLCLRYPLMVLVIGLVVGLLVGGLSVHFFGWTPDRWC